MRITAPSVLTRSINWFFPTHILVAVVMPGLDIEARTTARLDLGSTIFVPPSNPLGTRRCLPHQQQSIPSVCWGTFRSVFDTGAEASFKISRKWEMCKACFRFFFLDGLMHVFTVYRLFLREGRRPKSTLRSDSIDLNLLPASGKSIFTVHSRLIRLPIGRSGAWVSATSWKPRGDSR